jgi:hypothetical protein
MVTTRDYEPARQRLRNSIRASARDQRDDVERAPLHETAVQRYEYRSGQEVRCAREGDPRRAGET